ncbi:hypothetical protein GCM10022206_40570 [Streptomyces chiangmaiensis]
MSCGIAIAPKTSATIDISAIRARCARLNRDSQDMGRRLSLWLSGRPGTQMSPRLYTLVHRPVPIRRPTVGFPARRLLRTQYGP